MKKTLLVTIVSLLSVSSFANDYFIDINTKKIIEVRSSEKTSSSQLSKETDSEIAGVASGRLIIVQTEEGSKTCAVHRLFENGMALIGCLGMTKDFEPKPFLTNLILNTVDQEAVVAEVKSIDGFTKDAKATLANAVGTLKANSKVEILAVFANGEALVQHAGNHFFDTKVTLLRYKIERVNLSELKLN